MSIGRESIVHLLRAAPNKPPEGQPCNGCGICCALETCPAGRLRFWQKAGPCPALEWSVTATRYHCGLLMQPENYLRGVPQVAEKLLSQFFARSIAAGKGCDCSVEPEYQPDA